MNRIALIYLPWFNIVLENLGRLDINRTNDEDGHGSIINRLSSSSSYLFGKSSTTTSECTPRSNRFTLHIDKDSPLHVRNSTFFDAIAGQCKFVIKTEYM